MNIFSEQAPYYWQAGLPAIPLKPLSKVPAISAWQRYCHEMPTPSEQEDWLRGYPNGNIGLALGPVSGLCMVDIDDDDVEEAIRSVLPPPVWERRGKKGCQLAYLAPPDLQPFKLKGQRGMAVELLYTGNQAVLPGSIHPDTGLPYTSNCNLWEVV